MIDLTFFPSFAQLSSILRVKAEVLGTKRKVAIGADVLKELISRSLANVEFDQQWYLRTYPDVRDAWEKGTIKDPRDHFITTGYFEGRLPHETEVDEKWYLNAYPDVRKAIDERRIGSATEHYLQNGQTEGRSPNSSLEITMVHWSRLFAQA